MFGLELMNCPNLAVPVDVMHHVVRVESSYNPFAIGVVGGRLVRQPHDLQEALSTVRMLESRGYNFSLGLAQVNRYNLAKYGIDSYEKAFDTCTNLQAGSRILAECYSRADGDWGKSFSCYYSGNFVTGFRHGYVQKIFDSMWSGNNAPQRALTAAPIEVIGRSPAPQANPGRAFPLQSGRTQPVSRVEAVASLTYQNDGNPAQSLQMPLEQRGQDVVRAATVQTVAMQAATSRMDPEAALIAAARARTQPVATGRAAGMQARPTRREEFTGGIALPEMGGVPEGPAVSNGENANAENARKQNGGEVDEAFVF
jgi:type IV secretion system protein VirB1